MLSFPSIQKPSFPIGISYEDIALQSRKENGDDKIRRKFTDARITFTLTWNAMSREDYIILESFYINDCQTNVQEFLWNYPAINKANGRIENSVFNGNAFTVRFTSFSAQATEHSYYTVNVTLKGTIKGEAEEEFEYGEIIPIVYDDTVTYLYDNSYLSGDLIWGEQSRNESGNIGYVNNYTSEYFFSDNDIVDADISEDNESYTAHLDKNNQYAINVVNGIVQNNSVNNFQVKRIGTPFKSFAYEYLLDDLIEQVLDIKVKVKEYFTDLSGIKSCSVYDDTETYNLKWQNFKVNHNGQFTLTNALFYNLNMSIQMQRDDELRLRGEIINNVGSRSATAADLALDIFAGFTGNATIRYKKSKVQNTRYSKDNGIITRTKQKCLFTIGTQIVDGDDKTEYIGNPYIDGSNVTLYSYAFLYNDKEYREVIPTGFGLDHKENFIEYYTPQLGVTPITYNYLGYIGGGPTPKANSNTPRNEAINYYSRNSSATEVGIVALPNCYTDTTGEAPESYYDGEYVVGVLTGNGRTIKHKGEWYALYAMKLKYYFSVNLKNVLQGIFNDYSINSYVDVPIQDSYTARYICSSNLTTSVFSFVGIYKNNVFVVQPSLSISITDNLSFLQLADSSYLLGIYKKGLYWIKQSGKVVTLVSSNLYNFRLHYKQQK